MKKGITIMLGCLLATATSCVSRHMQQDLVSDRDSISGTYNFIQVGGTFGSDAERIVILDIEDDGYSFDPVTGPGRVKNFPGVEAKEALQRAEAFFSDHCAYRGYQVRTLVLKENDKMVGYELIPDYPTVLCEDGNEIQVNYGQAEDGVIKVYTTLLLKVKNGGSSPMIGREKTRR